MPAIYDTLGNTYSRTRQADERIVDRIIQHLGLKPGSRILDVGAGTGSYSFALADRGFEITALEPSKVMTSQASDHPRVSWVTASAESLFFESASFDAAILILCIHHFTDLAQALTEVQRVVGGGSILLFTYDPSAVETPWLFDYFPIFRTQIKKAFPSADCIAASLDSGRKLSFHPFLLPDDLKDSFAGAAWKYPERYLDQSFRDGTSAFRQLDPEIGQTCLDRLRGDLESGSWDQKYSKIRSLSEYDHGYTFILANGERVAAPNP
ncbi:MAG: methyltransferase domain-containing protein [Verrucomicrobiales bacterium]